MPRTEDTQVLRVVKIISSFEVVVNAGMDHGVTRGSILEVYSDGGLPIHDPETGELLGEIDYHKEYLKAICVYTKMCVCERSIEPMMALVCADLPPVERIQAYWDYAKEQIRQIGARQEADVIRLGDKVRLLAFRF